MELVVKRFDELCASELYDILELRCAVFVVEQNCVYQDLDGRDRRAYHVYLRDSGGIQAYLRVIERGVAFDHVSIGRVIAVQRRRGLGTRILKAGIEVAKEKYRAETIVLEAQTYAKGMYEKVGFKQISEEFLEDNIPHIRMSLDISPDFYD